MKFYTKFTLFWLLSIAPFYLVNAKSLLECLGKEELRIHKAKSDGPAYRLNQLFVNELSGFSKIALRKEYVPRVCESSTFSPSVSFLREVLLSGTKIFDLSKSSSNTNIYSYKLARIKSFKERVPLIFFNYLSSLGALAPHAFCLSNHVPNLSYFMDQYKYLEAEYTADRLMNDKGKLEELFNALEHLDGIIKTCKKEKPQMDKIRRAK